MFDPQVFTSKNVVVFNTGLASQRKELCRSLKALGVKRSEVTDVVHSSLPPWNTGNTNMFPRATLYSERVISKGEKSAAFSRTLSSATVSPQRFPVSDSG